MGEEGQGEGAMQQPGRGSWEPFELMTEDNDCVRIVASEESFPLQLLPPLDNHEEFLLDRLANTGRDSVRRSTESIAGSENIFDFDEAMYEVDFVKIAPRSPAGFDKNQHLRLKVVTNRADVPVFKLDKLPDRHHSTTSSLDVSTRRLEGSFCSFCSDAEPGCIQDAVDNEGSVRTRAIEEYLSTCYSMRTAPITGPPHAKE
uniref:Uncharacterized protein n=1 Tax=Guillardia theta TaxID=55529 RepID=A0A7S4H9A1_GUITH|mmetsp:Transcript_11091/g.37665  ORF Transcript_11091/g.37665 Transcript_11091/m.37665 type:complete len:202 (+) Transcript_11091:29-634(+)